jgi:hypothetical protein
MIAIECISTPALGACFALFCREIILAALLIMCNAAENFLPIAFRILRTAQDFRQERNFSSRSARRATRGFAVGFIPAVESPVATRRAPCFASLTFDGG